MIGTIPNNHISSKKSSKRDKLDKALQELEELYKRSLCGTKNPQILSDHPSSSILIQQIQGLQEHNEDPDFESYPISSNRLNELLQKYLPTSYLSQHIINHTIADMCKRKEAVTLIDIGIGTGYQAANIARLLKLKNPLLQAITIIGIDPSEENLHIAHKNILDASLVTGILIEFVPLTMKVQDLNVIDFKDLYDDTDTWPIIYSSFSLHHILDNCNDKAATIKKVFSMLHQLNPEALLFAEPDIDCCNKDFLKHLNNCVEYYSALFSLIDQLEIPTHEKGALKLFFSKEVDNIAGRKNNGSYFYLSALTWLECLKDSFFVADPDLLNLEFSIPSMLSIEYQPQHISLKFENTRIVSIICTVPK